MREYVLLLVSIIFSDANLLIFSDLHEKITHKHRNRFKLLTIVKLLNIFFWILWEKVLSLPQFMKFRI